MLQTLKAKKSFYLKAYALLKSWEQVYHAGRSYADHCIDVKRYHDYFDINALLKSIDAGKFADEIKTRLMNDGEEINQYYYNDFIAYLWEQANYELADIHNITENSPLYHPTFKHIKHDGSRQAWPTDEKSILWADGRSGGWACFNSHGQDYADTLENALNSNFTSAGEPVDDWQVNEMEDAENYYNNLKECLEEVNYIVNYIERFNKGSKFIDFMEDKAQQIKGELEEEDEKSQADERAKVNNLERAALELKPSLESIAKYIDKYIDKQPEKTKIIRQIKALKSVIKNAA